MGAKKRLDSRHTAFHEVGHAIAAIELEVVYDGVTILSKGDTAGHVSVEDDLCVFARPGSDIDSAESMKAFRKWTRDQALIDYAGHAATVVALSMGDMSDESAAAHGGGPDFEKARTRLKGKTAQIQRMKDRAVSLMIKRRDDLEILAEALLKRKSLNAQQIDWLLLRRTPLPDWLS